MIGFEVTNTSYGYGKGTLILNGITLKCEKGTVNTLLGLNGCGKTTLIKTMAGLYKPDGGKVTYDGKDIHALSDRERSAYIAYVNQHGNHVSDYPVQDYLLMSTINSLQPFEEPGRKQMEIVDRCLDLLGISGMKSKNIGQLSGGQRQLVYICAALVQDSEVILLDEPTSALDLRNEHTVLSTLKRIAEDTGKTIILSTHDPNHALFLDANVFLMDGGKIISNGPSRDIITAEKLKMVYGDGICFSSDLPYREISYTYCSVRNNSVE
ncbi:ABC-type cobalamin/Fe3+-siderophores transport systems, ATPase component [Thermoplasmatales archaeon BRNA1]|nr:ABC-type cobalamin/Fe3+-siderophores transport systems, ATPase component [Thermoplasmatales archaeon BRNA1]